MKRIQVKSLEISIQKKKKHNIIHAGTPVANKQIFYSCPLEFRVLFSVTAEK